MSVVLAALNKDMEVLKCRVLNRLPNWETVRRIVIKKQKTFDTSCVTTTNSTVNEMTCFLKYLCVYCLVSEQAECLLYCDRKGEIFYSECIITCSRQVRRMNRKYQTAFLQQSCYLLLYSFSVALVIFLVVLNWVMSAMHVFAVAVIYTAQAIFDQILLAHVSSRNLSLEMSWSLAC